MKKYLILFIFSLCACTKITEPKYSKQDIDLLHQCEKKLTDIIVIDIFSPPVASRIYANVNIAMFEAIRHIDGKSSLAAQLNGFEAMPEPTKGLEYDFVVAMIQAFSETAQKVTFSPTEIIDFEKEKMKILENRDSKEVFDRSKEFGSSIAKVMIKHLSQDNYKETRGMDRFEVDAKNPLRWVPTAPDYADGLEPNWAKMKTLVLDSANQCRPKMFPKFDLTSNSAYSKEIEEVYQTSKTLSKEQIDITTFWDDNPFVSKHIGHVEFNDKKMTPGGHWIAICGKASLRTQMGITNTMNAYALTSIALYEAFIASWSEKYITLRPRPQTIINKTRDEKWISYLQTPPFPEFTSGHSTISAAASVILTTLFGENHSFIDSTELEYGLPIRKFKSFKEAANQASESRILGGIHFRSGCESGVEQGEMVGGIVKKVLLKK